MFDHRHYVPILKWKQGEYQALLRLRSHVKDYITPLLEIPPIGFDHENDQLRETINQHLGDFGTRLHDKWGKRRCFVDLKLIPPATRMSDGSHYVEYVFGLTRAVACNAVPVVGFVNDPAYVTAVTNVVATDRRGICLRLSRIDFDRPTLAADIDAVLAHIGVTPDETDLVIDLESGSYIPVTGFIAGVTTYLGLIPHMAQWRSFTLAGTSYPPSVSVVPTPYGTLPRNEWTAYRAFISSLPARSRIPTFGDYAIAHPDLVELDMRLVQPYAKVRYTIDNAWHIGRGVSVRGNMGQYRDLCSDLVALPYFDGAGYCYGDDYIEACAAGGPTGSLGIWVTVAMNRHLTKVAADLAILHGP